MYNYVVRQDPIAAAWAGVAALFWILLCFVVWDANTID
jgi:hypothetical protein